MGTYKPPPPPPPPPWRGPWTQYEIDNAVWDTYYPKPGKRGWKSTREYVWEALSRIDPEAAKALEHEPGEDDDDEAPSRLPYNDD